MDEDCGEVIDRLPNGGVVILGLLNPYHHQRAGGYLAEWDFAHASPIGIPSGGPRPKGGSCYAECSPCGLLAGHDTDDPAQLSWDWATAEAWATEHNQNEHPELFNQPDDWSME